MDIVCGHDPRAEGPVWPPVMGCLPQPGHSLEGPSLQCPLTPALTPKYTSATGTGGAPDSSGLGWGPQARGAGEGGDMEPWLAMAIGGPWPAGRATPSETDHPGAVWDTRYMASPLCRRPPSLRPGVWGYSEHSLVPSVA